MWQYHNEDENLIVSIHSDFVKCSGGTAVTGHEHAEEGYEMGTAILPQCCSEQTLPLSAPWTFCRTSCPTPGPIYPRTRGHGCAAGADPGLWMSPSVPRQRCNTHTDMHLISGSSAGDTHSKISGTAKSRSPAAAVIRYNSSEVRQAG